jgi:hypothetical protein
MSLNYICTLAIPEDMYFCAHLECSSLNIIQGKKYFEVAQSKMKHVLFPMQFVCQSYIFQDNYTDLPV